MSPTEKQLTSWRQQGMTNREIARMTGKSVATINMLFHKYRIPKWDASIPQEEIDIMVRMKESGSSIKEIVEKTGYSESTVRNHMKAAGLVKERQMEPAAFSVAEPRKPHIFRTVVSGKRYIDVTDLYIHT